MKMTKHAIVRCQQRGINACDVNIVIQNGQRRWLPGGAKGYLFRKKDKTRVTQKYKNYIQTLDKLTGVEVVEGLSGMILTRLS